jgi:rhomboid protease GluP
VRLPLRRPWLTYGLLALIGAVFLAQLGLQATLGRDLVVALGAKSNAAIAAGQYWRLLTGVFIHANIIHFFFNAYALYYLGREVEAVAGAGRLAAIFLYAGLAGTTFSLLFNPSPSVGASGGIFGLIGALAVFLYRNRRLFGEGGRQRLRSIAGIAIINLLIGLSGGIDNWAHLGGLLGGAAMSWVIGPVWQVRVPTVLAPEGNVAEGFEPGGGVARWGAAGLLAALLAALIFLGIAWAGGTT